MTNPIVIMLARILNALLARRGSTFERTDE
jgi:hypothetical protein